MGARPAGGRPLATVLVAAVAGFAPALAAELSVRGRVLDPDARPARGARVELVPLLRHYDAALAAWRGEGEPQSAARATTDERGDFLLRAPEAGFWKTVVRAEGFVGAEHPLAPLTEDVHLPDLVLVRDQGILVEVVAGAADSSAEPSRLSPSPGESSSPPITTTEARAQGSVWIAVTTPDGRSPYADGSWRAAPRAASLATVPGSVRLARGEGEPVEIHAFGDGTPPVRVEAPGSRARVELEPPAPRLALRVTEEGGAPIAAALVCHAALGRPLALTDAEGRAEIAAARAQRLDLVVLTANHRARSFEVTPEDLSDGAPVLTLRRAERFQGTVVDDADGAPVRNTWIWMDLRWPANPARGLPAAIPGDLGAVVRSDGWGRFEAHLAAGARPRAAAAGYHAGEVLEVAGLPGGGFTVEPPPRDGSVVRLRRSRWLGGQVIDAAEQPVAGALVTLATVPQAYASQRAHTDERGRFRIGGLATGTGGVRLAVLAEGYAPSVEEVELGEATGRDDIVLRLRRGRVARGRVHDLEQRPVEGARVRLVEAVGGAGRPRPPWLVRKVPPLLTATLPDGTFALAGVPGGLYDVTVDAAGYAITALPGLAIPEGDGDADLGTLLVGPGVTVEGVVVDGDGSPLAGATIQVRRQPRFDRVAEPAGTEPWSSWLRRSEAGLTTAESDAEGRFVLADLNPSERVDLFVSLDGYVSAWVPRVGGPTEEPVRVVLEMGAAVLGRVVDESGEGIPRSTVSAQALASPDRQSAQVDGDGRFELRSLRSGSWRLEARASGYENGEATATVEAGEVEDGVRIVLREQEHGRIEGRVVDDESAPVPGARVNVLFAGTVGARTGSDGQFVIERVPLGRRRLRAASGQRSATEILDVREGTNTVEITLEGGVEVSGRVVDREGDGVAGATVSLSGARAPDLQWSAEMSIETSGGRRSTRSSGDGAFLVTEVRDCAYTVEAVLDGLGRGRLPGELRVAGAPISGLELVLEQGGSIRGAIEGLDFDQLSLVAIYGRGERAGVPGRVIGASEYLLDNLEAGEWHVTGDVREHGLHAEGIVTVEAGAEARLDLDFARGLTFSGLVTRRGEPAVGSLLMLRGVDVASSRGVTADFDGRYRIGGLEEGIYDLQVLPGRTAGSRVPWIKRIELYDDTELAIELRTGRLTGIVVDAAGGDPIAGATVRMREGSAESERRLFADTRETGAAGEFLFDDVPEGVFVLEAARQGYANADLGVALSEGAEIDGLVLELEPSAGLTLRVAGAFAPLAWIQVMVLDRGGRPIQGPLRLTPGTDGLFEVSGVAEGGWELLVGAPGLAWTRLAVAVPGPPVDVAMPMAGRLAVEIPELLGTSAVARLELVDGSGRHFPSISFDRYDPVFRLESGRRFIEGLPPGQWTLRATTLDGAQWTGVAATVPGALSQVRLD